MILSFSVILPVTKGKVNSGEEEEEGKKALKVRADTEYLPGSSLTAPTQSHTLALTGFAAATSKDAAIAIVVS